LSALTKKLGVWYGGKNDEKLPVKAVFLEAFFSPGKFTKPLNFFSKP